MGLFLLTLLVLVAVVETFVEVYAIVTDPERFDWKMVFAGIIGGLFTFLFNLDLLGYLGIQIAFDLPWLHTLLNVVILGVVIMRYSGNLNDVLEWVKALRPDKTT